ncbi:MAG: hypothetical protein ABIA04_00740 [Pseudomonadota bacterium]
MNKTFVLILLALFLNSSFAFTNECIDVFGNKQRQADQTTSYAEKKQEIPNTSRPSQNSSEHFVSFVSIGQIQMYSKYVAGLHEMHILFQNMTELVFHVEMQGGRDKRKLVVANNAHAYIKDLVSGQIISEVSAANIENSATSIYFNHRNQNLFQLSFSFHEREEHDARPPRISLNNNQNSEINYPTLYQHINTLGQANGSSFGDVKILDIEFLRDKRNRTRQSYVCEYRLLLSNGDTIVFKVDTGHHGKGNYTTAGLDAYLHRFADGNIIKLILSGSGNLIPGKIRINGQGYDIHLTIGSHEQEVVKAHPDIETSIIREAPSRPRKNIEDLKSLENTIPPDKRLIEKKALATQTLTIEDDTEAESKGFDSLLSDYPIVSRGIYPDATSADTITSLGKIRGSITSRTTKFTSLVARQLFSAANIPDKVAITLIVDVHGSKKHEVVIKTEEGCNELIIREFSYLQPIKDNGQIVGFRRIRKENIIATFVKREDHWSIIIEDIELRSFKAEFSRQSQAVFGFVIVSRNENALNASEKQGLRKNFQERLRRFGYKKEIDKEEKKSIQKKAPKEAIENEIRLVQDTLQITLDQGAKEQGHQDEGEAKRQETSKEEEREVLQAEDSSEFENLSSESVNSDMQAGFPENKILTADPEDWLLGRAILNAKPDQSIPVTLKYRSETTNADVVFVTLNVTAVNQRDVGDRLVLEEGIVEVFYNDELIEAEVLNLSGSKVIGLYYLHLIKANRYYPILFANWGSSADNQEFFISTKHDGYRDLVTMLNDRILYPSDILKIFTDSLEHRRLLAYRYFQSYGGPFMYLYEYDVKDMSGLDFLGGSDFLGFRFPNGEIIEAKVKKEDASGFAFDIKYQSGSHNYFDVELRIKPKDSNSFYYITHTCLAYRFSHYEVLALSLLNVAFIINKNTGEMHLLPLKPPGKKPLYKSSSFRGFLRKLPKALASYEIDESEFEHLNNGSSKENNSRKEPSQVQVDVVEENIPSSSIASEPMEGTGIIARLGRMLRKINIPKKFSKKKDAPDEERQGSSEEETDEQRENRFVNVARVFDSGATTEDIVGSGESLINDTLELCKRARLADVSIADQIDIKRPLEIDFEKINFETFAALMDKGYVHLEQDYFHFETMMMADLNKELIINSRITIGPLELFLTGYIDKASSKIKWDDMLTQGSFKGNSVVVTTLPGWEKTFPLLVIDPRSLTRLDLYLTVTQDGLVVYSARKYVRYGKKAQPDYGLDDPRKMLSDLEINKDIGMLFSNTNVEGMDFIFSEVAQTNQLSTGETFAQEGYQGFVIKPGTAIRFPLLYKRNKWVFDQENFHVSFLGSFGVHYLTGTNNVHLRRYGNIEVVRIPSLSIAVILDPKTSYLHPVPLSYVDIKAKKRNKRIEQYLADNQDRIIPWPELGELDVTLFLRLKVIDIVDNMQIPANESEAFWAGYEKLLTPPINFSKEEFIAAMTRIIDCADANGRAEFEEVRQVLEEVLLRLGLI